MDTALRPNSPGVKKGEWQRIRRVNQYHSCIAGVAWGDELYVFWTEGVVTGKCHTGRCRMLQVYPVHVLMGRLATILCLSILR